MGVFVIDEEAEVWGASNPIIHDMIDFFIRKEGERGYLIDLKNAFEWGYNSFRISELNNSDFVDLFKLIKDYIDNRYFLKLEYPKIELEDIFKDLMLKMQEAQRKRLQ